jgi:hypothetical protein
MLRHAFWRCYANARFRIPPLTAVAAVGTRLTIVRCRTLFRRLMMTKLVERQGALRTEKLKATVAYSARGGPPAPPFSRA